MNSDRDQPATTYSDDRYIQTLADEWLEIPEKAEAPILGATATPVNQRQRNHRTIGKPMGKPAKSFGFKRSQDITQVIAQAKAEINQRTTAQDITGEAGSSQHFYHNRGIITPWWIIITAWVVFGLPTLMLSIQQLSHLLHAAHSSVETPTGTSISTTVGMSLPLALVSITTTSIVFYILGRQTARRIRSDRRQERFRRYHKERETTVGSEN
jgi:hypothetical protein